MNVTLPSAEGDTTSTAVVGAGFVAKEVRDLAQAAVEAWGAEAVPEPEPEESVSPGRQLLVDSIRRFSPDDLTSPPPRQEWILYPYLPAGTVSILAGPGGSSKTTLLVALAVNRALGLPFFGGPMPRRGRTVILTTEDSRDDYLRKLAAVRHDLGDAFDPAAVAENVLLLDLAGTPVRLVESDRGNYFPTVLADDLAAVVSKHAPGTDLIVMETVSRLAGGIETNESLSILIEAGQRICRLTGAAVLPVAHVSQEAGRSGTTDAYAPRGGSALGDNGRSTLVLTSLTDKTAATFAPDADLPAGILNRLRVLVHPKSNGAEPAPPLLLERCSTPYGPVLRRAVLRSRQVDPGEQIDRLVSMIADLTAKGTPATEKRLRNYIAKIGCSEKKLPRLLDAALAASRVRKSETKCQGGGFPFEVVP